MFKLKKLLCCVIMLSSVFSTNIVNATTWYEPCYFDIYNEIHDENFKEIVDLYIRIKEKCELAEDCEEDIEDIEDYNQIVKENRFRIGPNPIAVNERSKSSVVRDYCSWRRDIQVKVNGENLYFEDRPQFQFKITDIPLDFNTKYWSGHKGTFMKILDKIPQQQPKLKISKRTFLKIFCSFLFSRGLINCDLFNSLYFSLFRNGTSFLLHLYFNNKENMKVVEEYRQEYWRTALVYKLGNDWVVCDPYLALNADSIEKGIRYLALPLEEYKELWYNLGMWLSYNNDDVNDDDVKIYMEDPRNFYMKSNRDVYNIGKKFEFENLNVDEMQQHVFEKARYRHRRFCGTDLLL